MQGVELKKKYGKSNYDKEIPSYICKNWTVSCEKFVKYDKKLYLGVSSKRQIAPFLLPKSGNSTITTTILQYFRAGFPKRLGHGPLSVTEQDFSVWPFRSGRLGLAISVWAVSVRSVSVWADSVWLGRSGRFGLAVLVTGHFGQTMKSCRNLTVH